jgi:hypothetical protein
MDGSMHGVFSDQNKLRRFLRIGDLLGYFISTLAAALLLPAETPFDFRTVVEMFLPFALVWMVIAPFAGLFRASIALQPRQLWFVAALTVIATPLGAWLGDVWSGISVGPTYIIALTILATLIIVGWRFVFIRLGQDGQDRSDS